MTVDGKAKPVSQEDPSTVGSVDEILTSGRYTDRRGREWAKAVPLIEWFCWEPVKMLQPSEMRLLIERDKHRDVCDGLYGCVEHPVPGVTVSYNEDGLMYYENTYTGRGYPDLPTAMSAARALAVGE